MNIGGWRVKTTHGVTVTIPSGTMLGAGKYIVIKHSKQWIDNVDEKLRLLNSNGNTIDTTPMFYDSANDIRTNQRIPNGSSTWQFRNNTPGLKNQ